VCRSTTIVSVVAPVTDHAEAPRRGDTVVAAALTGAPLLTPRVSVLPTGSSYREKSFPFLRRRAAIRNVKVGVATRAPSASVGPQEDGLTSPDPGQAKVETLARATGRGPGGSQAVGTAG